MSLRIAWATHQTNIKIGIAAQIFTYAGTVLLYFCQLFFTQRIVRAQHPKFGWSIPFRVYIRFWIASVVLVLIMIIVSSIQSFYTINTNTQRIDHDIQLMGGTYFAVVSFIPIPTILVSCLFPRKEQIDKFGEGRFRSKIYIVLLAAASLSIGSWFRAGTAYYPEVPLTAPTPWYFSRACFYCFQFLTEWLVVLMYALVRFDLRFYVPDGCKGPGSYTSRLEKMWAERENLEEEAFSGVPHEKPVDVQESTLKVYDDDVFADSRTLAESLKYPASSLQLDSQTGKYKVKRMSSASMYSGYTGHTGHETRVGAPSTRYSQVDGTSVYSAV